MFNPVVQVYNLIISTMTLTIDNRERLILSRLKELGDEEFTVIQMDLGDFLLENNTNKVIFERKTVDDLLASVKDNRYREQKMRILQEKQNGAKIVYIIEGKIDLSNECLLGCFISMQIRDEIPMIFTKNLDETIVYLLGARKRVRSDPDKFFSKKDVTRDDYLINSINPRKKDNITKESVFLNQLCAIPDISILKAKAIVENTKATCMGGFIPLLDGMNCPGIAKKLKQNLIDNLII